MQYTVAEATETETAKGMTKDVSQGEADRIIRHHVYASMGIGMLPFPLLDFAGLAGIQFNMLKKIAGVYEIPFSKGAVKNILCYVLGGAFPVLHVAPLAASVTKLVPAAGQAIGVTAMPILSGATTYAIGKVFMLHFASGAWGGIFDLEKMRTHYAEMLEEGKKVAEDMKKAGGSKEKISKI